MTTDTPTGRPTPRLSVGPSAAPRRGTRPPPCALVFFFNFVWDGGGWGYPSAGTLGGAGLTVRTKTNRGPKPARAGADGLVVQPARSLYIFGKLRGISQYTVLREGLIAATEGTAGDKRVPPKLISQLETLTAFHIEYEPKLFPSLLSLLEYEDPTVVRLAHYLMTRFEGTQVPDDRALYSALSGAVSDEGEAIGPRVAALASLTHLTKVQDLRTDLLPLLSSHLQWATSAAPPSKAAKDARRRRTSFFRRGPSEAAEKAAMQLACVRGARSRLPAEGELFPDIALGMWSTDPVVSRHSMALMALYAETHTADVDRVLFPVRRAARAIEAIESAAAAAAAAADPGPSDSAKKEAAKKEAKKKEKQEKKKEKKEKKMKRGGKERAEISAAYPTTDLSAGDELTRMYYIRTVGTLAFAPTGFHQAEFFAEITAGLLDPSPRVFLEAVYQLARPAAWAKLVSATVKAPEVVGHHIHANKLVDKSAVEIIIERIRSELLDIDAMERSALASVELSLGGQAATAGPEPGGGSGAPSSMSPAQVESDDQIAANLMANGGMSAPRLTVLEGLDPLVFKPRLSQPLMHATARVFSQLARAYWSSEAADRSSHPLGSLQAVFVVMASNTYDTNPYIRAQAIMSVLWTEPTVGGGRSSPFQKLLLHELANSSMQPALVSKIFSALLQRMLETGEWIREGLDLVYRWIAIDPDSVDENVVRALWQNLKKITSDSVRAEVLRVAFRSLDQLDETTAKSASLRTTFLWFLGENGNFLTSETPGRYDAGSIASWAPPATTPLSRAGGAKAGGPGPDGELTLSPSLAADLSAYGQALHDSLHSESMTDSGLSTPNPAMRSVVARLQAAAWSSSWHGRLTALHGLAKIAFRSGEPLRISIYEFLVNLDRNSGPELRLWLAPINRILDAIYGGLALLNDFPREPSQAPPVKLSQLATLHGQLLTAIRTYGYVRDDFLPLGSLSRPFLEAAAANPS